MSESFLPISIGILVVSIILTAIILGIKASKSRSKNEEVFTIRLFWHAYLYSMTLLSLSLFMYGGIRFTKAMFAKYINPEFSYTTYMYNPEEYKPVGGETQVKPIEDMYDPVKSGDQKIIEKDGKKYAYDYSMYRSDIVDGLTMFISLVIIFAVHRFLIYRGDKDSDSFFRKIYNFVGLAQFGVLTLIALPFGIYQLIRYFTEVSNFASYSRPVPGPAIAMLIFVLPAWIIFLVKMINANKS